VASLTLSGLPSLLSQRKKKWDGASWFPLRAARKKLGMLAGSTVTPLRALGLRKMTGATIIQVIKATRGPRGRIPGIRGVLAIPAIRKIREMKEMSRMTETIETLRMIEMSKMTEMIETLRMIDKMTSILKRAVKAIMSGWTVNKKNLKLLLA
jgi:hypothetical protein